MSKKKFFITTTIPASLNFFKGNLSFLNKYYDVTAISSNRDFLLEVGKREGINIFYIPMVRPISLLMDIVCLFKFIFFFIKERPYIVHGNTPKASFLSMISSWLVRVPIRIYMCHGLRYQGENNKYKRQLLMWMEKISCLCATKVICVSNGVKQTLIEDNICSCKKAIVVHFGSASGIDIDFFDKGFSVVDFQKKGSRVNYKVRAKTEGFSHCDLQKSAWDGLISHHLFKIEQKVGSLRQCDYDQVRYLELLDLQGKSYHQAQNGLVVNTSMTIVPELYPNDWCDMTAEIAKVLKK